MAIRPGSRRSSVLCCNAGKFTDRGGRVSLRLEKRDDQGAACITIEDTGIGMEPDIVARLFEPFSQADRSLDRSRGGLGLGFVARFEHG